MSIDIIDLTTDLSLVVSSGIYLLVIVRAVQIGNALVGRIFRRRAFWLAAIGVFATLANVVSLTFFPPVNILGIPAGVFFLLLAIVILFAFLDSTVLVTLEMDFFHRDTLLWREIRTFAYIVLCVEVAFLISLAYLTSLPSPPFWVTAINSSLNAPNAPALGVVIFVTVAIVYAYSVAAIVVGVRRASDLTMKRHLRLLGWAIVVIVILIANDFVLISTYNILSIALYDFVTAFVPFLIYRAVMSLSPTRRIMKETA